MTTSTIDKTKVLLHVTYGLYAVTPLLWPIPAIVAVVINYVKRDDAAGTWLASHFRWQIRTFWFALIWGIVGVATLVILVGFVVLMAVGVWLIYRLVKGWLYLNDGKPMYAAKPGALASRA
jgi:uncharacterized membrane protein